MALYHSRERVAMQTNMLESKNRLSELVKRAQAGEEIVITNRGVPTVRLEPVRALSAGTASEDILGWLARNPLPAHARRTREEIEADIQREREEWG